MYACGTFVYDTLQLGGSHSNGYISDLFAKAFAVELIQRRERELGTDMLTHQKVRTRILKGAGRSDGLYVVERRGLRR